MNQEQLKENLLNLFEDSMKKRERKIIRRFIFSVIVVVGLSALFVATVSIVSYFTL